MIWLALLYLVIGGAFAGIMCKLISKDTPTAKALNVKEISFMIFVSAAITWPVFMTIVLILIVEKLLYFLWKLLLLIFSSPITYMIICTILIFYSCSKSEPAEAGIITGEKHIAGMPVLFEKLDEPVYPYEIELLAEVMYHENWHTDPDHLAAYYTGAVVMNRVNAKCWPDTITKVLYQKGQYSTTHKFFTKELPEECYQMAMEVYRGTPDVPEDVVFQAMFKQGRGVWKVVKTDYFCYGRIE